MMNRALFSSLAIPRGDPELIRTPPVVPLPVLDDRPPVLLVFDHTELAIELAYERFPRPGGNRIRATTRSTTLYLIPKLTPVFAVSEGFVVYARQHSDGHTIVIDHRNGWATVYSRVDHMFVTPSDRFPRHETKVSAGDILGYVSTSESGPLDPLRFELWRCNRTDDYEQMDPLRYIRQWKYVAWSDARIDWRSRAPT